MTFHTYMYTTVDCTHRETDEVLVLTSNNSLIYIPSGIDRFFRHWRWSAFIKSTKHSSRLRHA